MSPLYCDEQCQKRLQIAKRSEGKTPQPLTLVNISAGLPVISQLVPRQAAAPAPHCVETKLIRAAVVDIRAALVNIPALLAVSQPLVTRLAG